MKLPPLPKPDVEAYHFTKAQMFAFRAATVEACAQVLLESGFRSTGIPAYESLAEKLRGMK
jgi:hypothetical protein